MKKALKVTGICLGVVSGCMIGLAIIEAIIAHNREDRYDSIVPDNLDNFDAFADDAFAYDKE